MNLLTCFRIAAAGLLLAAGASASAQVQFTCSFPGSPTDCGFNEQSFSLPRAAILNSVSRDGSTSIQLTTQPGDSNVAGSGTNERDDLQLNPSAAYCNQGQTEWWSHSIMFPTDYVVPPSGSTWNWGVVFDFHQTGSTGQPPFMVVSVPTGLEFRGAGGPTPVNGPGDPGYYSAPIGPVVKNTWYDFVYNVKWSSNSDGFFKAWVNGVQKLNFSGPTLYPGDSCYLKLANYHTPLGVSMSVIHDRVIRGVTQADVTGSASGGGGGTTPPPPAPVRSASSDFDGNGKSDILWRDLVTGQNAIWIMNGGTLVSSTNLTTLADLNWKIMGTGDFDGDGDADILWRNSSTGRNRIWFMKGGTVTSTSDLPGLSSNGWKYAGIGDFDGDGKSDILWRNSSSGQNQIWLMNGATVTSSTSITKVPDLNWSVVAVGDFDGNKKSDILWRNKSTGANQIWFMNGTTLASASAITTVTDLNWNVAGAGDFDGNGKSDVLWRNKSTGENAIFFMDGATVLSITYITQVADQNWGIAGTGDFDGDGKSDVLWRNKTTGENAIFFMNAGTVTSTTFITSVPATEWAIAQR